MPKEKGLIENFVEEVTLRTQQHTTNNRCLGKCEFCYNVLRFIILAICCEYLTFYLGTPVYFCEMLLSQEKNR